MLSLGKLAAGVLGQTLMNLGQLVSRPGNWAPWSLVEVLCLHVSGACFHWGVSGS